MHGVSQRPAHAARHASGAPGGHAEHYGAPHLAPYRERCAAFPINQTIACEYKRLPTGKLWDDPAWYRQARRDAICQLWEAAGAVRVYEIALDHQRGRRPVIVAFGEWLRMGVADGFTGTADMGAFYLLRTPDCRPTSVAEGIEGTRIDWSVHDSETASALIWYRDRWLVVSSMRYGSGAYELHLQALESRPAVRQQCLFFSGEKPPPARRR